MSRLTRPISYICGVAACVLAISSASAALSGGRHHLKVWVHSNIYSIYITSQTGLGESFSVCRKLGGAPKGGGWLDGKQDLLNGRAYIIDTFTSNDCGAGMVTQKKGVVPGDDDKNDNVWVQLL